MDLTYTLSFDGAVLSAGLGTHDAGLDAAQQRDAWNRRILPARHMRGRVREALEEMAASYAVSRAATPSREAAQAAENAAFAAVARLLGDGDGSHRPGASARAFDRSAVSFTDAVAVPEGNAIDGVRGRAGGSGLQRLEAGHLVGTTTPAPSHTAVRHRIAVSRHTGTVLPAHLGMNEAGAAGTLEHFRGAIEVPDGGTLGLSGVELVGLLGWAMRWLEAVGRTTQSGWGRIHKRCIEPAPSADLRDLLDRLLDERAHATLGFPSTTVAGSSSTGLVTIGFAVVLDAPLVVGDRAPMANVIEGRSDIPGSVIRRGLADVLLAAAGLRRGGWVDPSVASKVSDPTLQPLAARLHEVEASFALWVPPGDRRELPDPSGDPRTMPDPPSQTAAGGDFLARQIDASLGNHDALDALVEAHQARAFKKTSTQPPLELRTHVTKSRASGGGSEGNLFSVRAIRPCDAGSQHTRLDGMIRCPADLQEQVRHGLARIRRLGKSTAQGYGAVRIYETTPPEDGWKARLRQWNDLRQTGVGSVEVPILLVTEALLLDPAKVRSRPRHGGGAARNRGRGPGAGLEAGDGSTQVGAGGGLAGRARRAVQGGVFAWANRPLVERAWDQATEALRSLEEEALRARP